MTRRNYQAAIFNNKHRQSGPKLDKNGLKMIVSLKSILINHKSMIFFTIFWFNIVHSELQCKAK